MKKCPYCGEEIQDSAKKCRYCGEWLGEITEQPASKPENTDAFFLIPGLEDKLCELIEKGGTLDFYNKSLILDDAECIMTIASPSCKLVWGPKGEEKPFPNNPEGMVLTISFLSKCSLSAFNVLEERRHKSFMELSVSQSFMHKYYPENEYYCDEYVMDLGEDTAVAAKIISQIASKVFNCTETSAPRLLLANNDKQREKQKNELLKEWGLDEDEQKADKSFIITYIITGLIIVIIGLVAGFIV